MDKEGTGSCGSAFAPDVLADILTRLPPNARRRLRLVCRHWRHIVDTRTTTDLRNRAKTIVATRETAFVFEDLSAAGRPRELWSRGTADGFKGMSMVGTCNGLICLCDIKSGGRGAITLVNPVTGGTLSIPPLPSPYAYGNRKWHQTYSFTYHHTTGRYKIVHIPSKLNRVLLVFTLGEASWREVRKPGAICDLDAGIVSADGYMYLAVAGTEARIMSFDLNHEKFTTLEPLPNTLSKPGSWGLTEVHGRLGIAFTHVSHTLAKTDVWVMEGMPGQYKWSCRYILQDHKPRHAAYYEWGRRYLASPHFAHNGKYVLTEDANNTLFIHVPSEDTRKARHGVVEINQKNQGRAINNIGAIKNIAPYYNTYFHTYDYYNCPAMATFCYVETMEQLSAYKCW